MSNSEKVEQNRSTKYLNTKEPAKEAKSLSFFTADENYTSSESESDEEKSKAETASASDGSVEPGNIMKSKLPSPTTLFATVGKPKFLDRPLEDEEVDWTSLCKRYEPSFDYSSVSYPRETVDLSSTERSEATISGAPVKYKTEISETKRHLFLHGKRSGDLSSIMAGDKPDGETSSKKQKPC